MNELNQTRYTLLQRACDLHDEVAWEEFVDHYRRFIFYILHKLGVDAGDVEDLTQQVLFSLTKDLPNYDRARAIPHLAQCGDSSCRIGAFPKAEKPTGAHSHFRGGTER
jgi:RNA polymerase sigma-70 factor (ECF subfamily)